MHDYSIGFWREGSGVRHEQHCMKVAVAAPSCMPSSSEYRKLGKAITLQPNSNRTETGLLESKPIPRNGLLQKALLFLTRAPTPPTSSVTRLIMRHRHTRAAVTTGKGGGGGRCYKSAAFRNGTRACTTMGISTAGEVGHYTESADSATAHEDLQKPFDFAYLAVSGECALRGR